ncbi:MAG TPA: metallophosphoesterase [Anaerolineaceae bacterium]|nr:metallophosphoesterase [Anaerolineaceae bacterium]
MSRILVLSDIHGNLDALEAVLGDAGKVDAVWCLGDVVGYGPQPKECLHRLANLPHLTCVQGNHDAAVTGKLDLYAFNREAILSIQWTRAQLSTTDVEWLANLPEKVELQEVTLTHGSPRNPIWEYLLDLNTVHINFAHFTTDFCLVGHTHIPVLYTYVNKKNGNDKDEGYVDWMIPPPNRAIKMIPRSIYNPGSVGQPRDRDVRAAYAIYEPESQEWELRRVEYDIRAVQQKILAAGLPSRHASRLEEGW